MIGETIETSRKSPIDLYLKWVWFKDEKKELDGEEVTVKKGIHKFEFFDKILEKKIYANPVDFIVLEDMAVSITGFNQLKNCGIYSNHIRSSKNEEFNVMLQNGEKLISGIYADIKDDLISYGGKFTRDLLVLQDGCIRDYQFTGSTLKQLNDSLVGIDLNKYKLEFDGFEEKTTGSIKYSVPKWKQGKEINKEEREEVNAKVEILKEYFA